MCNASFTDELVLMKLYTVAVNNLGMCTKGDPKYVKGDNSREIISSAGRGYPL